MPPMPLGPIALQGSSNTSLSRPGLVCMFELLRELGVVGLTVLPNDHAVSAYDKALAEDISPSLHSIVERQFGDVKAAHDDVRSRRNAYS